MDSFFDELAASPGRKAAAAARESDPAGDDGREFAILAARVAADLRAAGVTVIDLRGLSGVADFFVIGTGTSGRQMHAILDRVEEEARLTGRRVFKRADSENSAWLLADYVDVIVHLFDEEHRGYYDLDGLWGDAPRVAWERPGSGDLGAEASAAE